MRHLFYVLMVAILQSAASFAQQPQATPPPQPPLPQPTPRLQPVRVVRFPMANNPFGRNSAADSDQLASRVAILHTFVSPLYRKPTNREMAVLLPSPRVLSQYSTFLRAPNTGVFRLVPDAGCAPSDKVINASEHCLKYTMPGAGNSFSFRTERHRIKNLADITLAGDRLKIPGVFMHGMMADIGDVPIETVSLTSPGMRFISGFEPSTNAGSVIEIDSKLSRGAELDGFRYSKEAAAAENSTYVFRAVAYRGKVMRSARGVAYNELDYDRRKDVIVVFRIAERDSDGSVTIVWKELADLESPKIKMPKMKAQEDENSDEP